MKVVSLIFYFLLLLGCARRHKNNDKIVEDYSYSIIQNSQRLQVLKDQLLTDAKEIMNLFDIGIRENIYKDDSLVFVIDSSLNLFNAKFTSSWELDSGAIVWSLRWARAPRIRLSGILKSVVLKETDTTLIVYLKATSIILHELVHYIQKTPEGKNHYPSSLRDHRMSTRNLKEFEAYSVSSFYFLREYDRKKLNEIMNSNQNMETKRYLIMNVVADILYPE